MERRRGRLTRRTLVHELFAAQAAARARGSAAVGFGGEALTYGELDARAPTAWPAACAAWGWAGGAGGGLRSSARSELVVALLAVLKAGGAYLPLDPAYPARAPGLHAARTPARRCW